MEMFLNEAELRSAENIPFYIDSFIDKIDFVFFISFNLISDINDSFECDIIDTYHYYLVHRIAFKVSFN